MTFFNPFRRARRRPSAEDWQAGDLAECVYQGPWLNARTREFVTLGAPERGQRFRVLRVCTHPWRGWVALNLAGRGDSLFEATAFRKVRPQADEATAADAAFAQQLRQLTPPKAPARELEETAERGGAGQ